MVRRLRGRTHGYAKLDKAQDDDEDHNGGGNVEEVEEEEDDFMYGRNAPSGGLGGSTKGNAVKNAMFSIEPNEEED
jgi:hypothetical protein